MLFSAVQYDWIYVSCSSGCESKNMEGDPKSSTGGPDIVQILNGQEEVGFTSR